MKLFVFFLIWNLSMLKCFGQENTNRMPVIDMHLHVYSNKNYWVGEDIPVLTNKVLTFPETSTLHTEKVIEQMNRNNIVLSYASGDFDALDSLNKKYPGRFFPSIEIWPTRELFRNAEYIGTLKQKIAKGEIKGIGEVLNFYYGIAPNDPVMDTLYKIAIDYDMPVGIHFGLAPPGSQLNKFPEMRIEFGNPLLIQDVLIKFPELRLNIMHAALPSFQDQTFAVMNMFPDVYADIGVLTWMDDYTKGSVKSFLIKACEYGFAERIMFGSDEMVWPESIQLAVDFIKQADFLTEKQKRDILYNNAAKFLRINGNTGIAGK